jgi:hypothetical protein
MYQRVLIGVSVLAFALTICVTSVLAKGGLSDEISQMWKSEHRMPEKYNQKITSFFIKSAENQPVKLTMLIAFSEKITQTVRQIVKTDVTPLICSVASLPLESTEFRPEMLEFQQGRYVWSPQMSDTSWDAFPLGRAAAFGGIIEDSQIHQGVILLPAWFDIHKPINVTYQGASKRMLLTYK